MSNPLRTVGCTVAGVLPNWDDKDEEDGDWLFRLLNESVTRISVEEDLDLDLSFFLMLDNSLAFIALPVDKSGLLFLLQLPFILLIEEGNGSDPI